MEWVKPTEIEARSMQIIESEMPKGNWTPGELLVVKRCIHTSADFDYAENLYFSDHAVEQAIEILKAGATIVTDTNMGMAGINKRVSMEHAGKLEGPVIFAVGNAPTALIRLYEMIQEGTISPAFIIGAPVGFVNVVESKELICNLDVPCIVARGRKGGSNIVAAICNALMYQIPGTR